MRRQYVTERESKDIVVRNHRDLYQVFRPYAKERQECFLVATLDGAHKVIKVHLVTRGLVNRTLAHPREVFYAAIMDNASVVAVAHNHPSGNTTSSPEDIEITKNLVAAGEVMGIKVIDHIVFSETGFESHAARGIIRID